MKNTTLLTLALLFTAMLPYAPTQANKTDESLVTKEKATTMSQKELNNSLLKAINNKDIAAIKAALKQGASPDAKDNWGDTPIEALVKIAFMDDDKRQEIIELLLSHGADINHVDSLGLSYLHHFASMGYMDLTTLLLKNGIDTRAKREFDGASAMFSLRSVEMAKLLLPIFGTKETDKDGNTLLHDACGALPQLEMVKFYSKHIPIDSINKKGQTPLLKITRDNMQMDDRVKVITFLLSKGADVNAVDNQGRTPLMNVLWERDYDSSTIKLLLDNGANINSRDKLGAQAIHYASTENLRYIKVLIESGADLNAMSNTGETPLMIAARHNHEDIVKYLLNQRVNVNIKDSRNRTALNYALKGDFGDIIEMLESAGALATQKADILPSTDDSKNSETLNSINTIEDAIADENLALVKKFFKADTAIATDEVRMNRLLFLSTENETDDIFFYLAKHGGDLSSKDDDGFSLLHNAVYFNHLEIAKYLIKNDVSIDTKTTDGSTIFDMATNSSLGMIQLLLLHNVSYDINDDTLIANAILRLKPDLAKFLIQKGFKFNKEYIENEKIILRAFQYASSDTLDFLLENGLDINHEISVYGETAPLLFQAVILNYPRTTKYLLSKGANPYAKSHSGESIFRQAVNKENLQILDLLFSAMNNVSELKSGLTTSPLETAFNLQRIDVVRMLLDKGANVNEVSLSNGYTPLHYAASKGYLQTSRRLLKSGASPNQKNHDGKTALDLAKEHQRESIVRLLSQWQSR